MERLLVPGFFPFHLLDIQLNIHFFAELHLEPGWFRNTQKRYNTAYLQPQWIIFAAGRAEMEVKSNVWNDPSLLRHHVVSIK